MLYTGFNNLIPLVRIMRTRRVSKCQIIHYNRFNAHLLTAAAFWMCFLYEAHTALTSISWLGRVGAIEVANDAREA